MKYLIIILSLLPVSLFSQVDMMEDGLAACMHEKDLSFINQLKAELEAFSFKSLAVPNGDYELLTAAFCNNEISEIFKLEANSKLESLIKQGIKSNFWIYEEYDPNELTIVNGDTITVTPPADTEMNTLQKEDIEQVYINPLCEYFTCSKDYTFQIGLLAYYRSYDSFKVGSSNVKLCGLMDFFSESDYKLASIKHFILIHCICQKIIHENGFYAEFDN